jgi:hypothetical protein
MHFASRIGHIPEIVCPTVPIKGSPINGLHEVEFAEQIVEGLIALIDYHD